MVAVFVLDSRLRCGFVNNVGEFLTGRTNAQAAGRHIGELLLVERGRAFELSVIGRALSEGGAHEGQEQLTGHDGIERPFAFRIAPLSVELAEGAVLELLDLSGETGTSRALRESEQRLRLAVEATSIGIWDVDATRGTRRWSPEFSAILGLPVTFEGDAGVFESLIHPDDREPVLALYRSAYEPGADGTYNAEFRIRRADTGEVRWVSATGRVTFGADGRALRGVGTLDDITERREAEEHQRLILRELNHRVKNNLAVVQAIVSQTMRMSPRPAEAFGRIQARLMALSRTHDFLNKSDWGGVSLAGLLQGELAPHTSLDPERIVLGGQTVVLDSTLALSLGLVFHELATNAVKFGALSAETGRLQVRWALTGDGDTPTLQIDWIESRGPPVRPPRRRGFGSRLIEGSVTGRLGGSVEMDFARDGLRCRLTFPLPRETPTAEG